MSFLADMYSFVDSIKNYMSFSFFHIYKVKKKGPLLVKIYIYKISNAYQQGNKEKYMITRNSYSSFETSKALQIGFY